MIYVNTRTLSSNLTGSQRYLAELNSRLAKDIFPISPKSPLRGLHGHLWEQSLGFSINKKSVLWSPSNTGPLFVGRHVVTLHDVVPLDHPEWLSNGFALWYRWLTPKLVSKANAIITVSEFSKKRILNFVDVDESKIHVIYNGVDEKFSPNKTISDNDLVEKLKIPSRNFVLSVCSLEPRKNLIRLIEAWRVMESKISDDTWLVLAGGLGLGNIFKEVDFSSLPPRVFFTGRVDDAILPALYRASLGFVYISMYEGFGLPPIEAMASGIPVLVSDKTAMPEVVDDCGLLVDPFSVESISLGLIEIINNVSVREKFSKRGLAQSKKFNWNDCANKTLNVLKAVELS